LFVTAELKTLTFQEKAQCVTWFTKNRSYFQMQLNTHTKYLRTPASTSVHERHKWQKQFK